MNAIIMNGDVILSKVMTKDKALKRCEELKKAIYPNAVVVETAQAVIEEKQYDITPEIVEDVGCTGGSCTL